jgi:hypothetical protein
MARLLLSRPEFKCPNGQAVHDQRRVRERREDGAGSHGSSRFSSIIRDSLQWVRSPLTLRGDFAIAGYVVRPFLRSGEATCAYPDPFLLSAGASEDHVA